MYPRSLKYSGIVVKFPEVFRQYGGEREANAGSAQSRWLMGSSGLRPQLYVSNIRWVDGCRLVKIDAREGAQVAMVT